jgi:Protein of unknown function (DUF1499)
MVNLPRIQGGGQGDMITKKSIRQSSVSARWSVRCAIFALALMAVATLLHRFGQVETGPFLSILIIVALLAGFGLMLSVIGLIGLWRHAYAGGRRAAAAFVLSALALAPFGLALHKAATLPMLADISTDLADPPQFAGAPASGLKQELQTAAYPQVTGRRYVMAGDGLAALIERQIAGNGWRVIERRGSLEGGGELLVEAEAVTFIAGFRDRVVIRVTDEGETSYVDMRSRSGFGSYDMGANAARIVKFMQALDILAGAGSGAQSAK